MTTNPLLEINGEQIHNRALELNSNSDDRQALAKYLAYSNDYISVEAFVKSEFSYINHIAGYDTAKSVAVATMNRGKFLWEQARKDLMKNPPANQKSRRLSEFTTIEIVNVKNELARCFERAKSVIPSHKLQFTTIVGGKDEGLCSLSHIIKSKRITYYNSYGTTPIAHGTADLTDTAIEYLCAVAGVDMEEHDVKLQFKQLDVHEWWKKAIRNPNL